MVGLILIILGLEYSIETINNLKVLILLLLNRLGFPLSFFGNYYEFPDLYLLIIGYLLLFFSFSTILYDLKIKIPNFWRHFSFLLSEVYGFILFFLYLTIYTPQNSSESIFILDIPFISITLILTGSLILIWGLKEKWDRIWKFMSINISEIIGIVIILLGLVIYENSNTKWIIFSTPSSTNINIAIFLIISGLFINIGVLILLAINYIFKIRNINFLFLFTSIISSNLFFLIGLVNFVLEFVSINTFNLIYSSIASIYIIISLIFSSVFIFSLIIIKKDIFQIALQIKSLNKEDPIQKMSELTPSELQSLNNIDIFTVSDLANEEDLEGISKITKINFDRVKFIVDLAKNSLSKKSSIN